VDSSLLPIVDLPDSPRERGRAHGESLRSKIREVHERHLAYRGDYFGMDPEAYLAAFAAEANHRPAIERFAPDLLEEVMGIAEGSGLPEPTVYQMQLVDEEWQHGFFRHKPARPRQKCTSFGAVGRTVTIAGQNMDVPPFVDGCQALLRFRHEELETLVFTFAGLIGLTGINSAPLSICCNSLNELDPSLKGLPVAYVLRTLLKLSSFDQAEAFLNEVPHASGQNYLVAAPGRVGAFECSAAGAAQYRGDGAGRICHTNHALASEARGRFERLLGTLEEWERPTFLNSRRRFETTAARLSGWAEVTVEHAKAALRAHDDPENPVSRTDADVRGSAIGFTAGSIVYELDRPPVMHVTAGPPCSNDYRSIALC
jgi:hypothetical protein